MTIQLLPDHLVNQIAAGEVVERPASVVKELVENSLDAGAGRVVVQVEKGGSRLCRVRDDGVGIAAAELGVALTRHATSKIASLEELRTVATLGFRGEALPSIAAVARLTLTSRVAGERSGWTVSSSGGSTSEPQPAAHPQGSTVEVRDLFYNTPARRSFLRKPVTETRHIDRALLRMALSRHSTGMRYEKDGRLSYDLPPARNRELEEKRIAKLLGPQFIEHALYFEEQRHGIHLRGWLARPKYSRSQGDMQHLFLNGRAIFDRTVAHAVRQAYEDVMFHGRHPAWLLYLEMDPAQVDVNAHPAKLEVRFREGRKVHDVVRRTLEAVLAGTRPGRMAAEEATEHDRGGRFRGQASAPGGPAARHAGRPAWRLAPPAGYRPGPRARARAPVGGARGGNPAPGLCAGPTGRHLYPRGEQRGPDHRGRARGPRAGGLRADEGAARRPGSGGAVVARAGPFAGWPRGHGRGRAAARSLEAAGFCGGPGGTGDAGGAGGSGAARGRGRRGHAPRPAFGCAGASGGGERGLGRGTYGADSPYPRDDGLPHFG